MRQPNAHSVAPTAPTDWHSEVIIVRTCAFHSTLSLAARLHRCCANHSQYINNGWTFSGQTSYGPCWSIEEPGIPGPRNWWEAILCSKIYSAFLVILLVQQSQALFFSSIEKKKNTLVGWVVQSSLHLLKFTHLRFLKIDSHPVKFFFQALHSWSIFPLGT